MHRGRPTDLVAFELLERISTIRITNLVAVVLPLVVPWMENVGIIAVPEKIKSTRREFGTIFGKCFAWDNCSSPKRNIQEQ